MLMIILLFLRRCSNVHDIGYIYQHEHIDSVIQFHL